VRNKSANTNCNDFTKFVTVFGFTYTELPLAFKKELKNNDELVSKFGLLYAYSSLG
jgi:hypothetical protein